MSKQELGKLECHQQRTEVAQFYQNGKKNILLALFCRLSEGPNKLLSAGDWILMASLCINYANIEDVELHSLS